MITFKVENLREMNPSLKDFLEYLQSQNVDEDDVFDSRLVSCELISNVLKHCGETAHFSGFLNGDEIIIKVSGENSFSSIPKPTLPDVFAESGRGLYIINAVSGGNVTVCGNGVVVVLKRK